MKFLFRKFMVWCWRFVLWRWVVLQVVRLAPARVGNWLAFVTPLAFSLREYFLVNGRLDLAAGIRSDLVGRGDL